MSQTRGIAGGFRVGDLLEPFDERLGVELEPEVLTLTEGRGFVAQSERFNKRLAVADTAGYKVIRIHDIAFNPYLLWAGAIAQNTSWSRAVISPLYPTFRVRTGFDPRFVGRLLSSSSMIKRYDVIAFGSVPRRRRTSVMDFLNLCVDVPPTIEKQRLAAEVLDKAEDLRIRRRATIATLESLTQSVFVDMFGGTAFNSADWQTAKVGEVGDVQGGLQVTSSRASLSLEVPYLRVANVFRGAMDLREIKSIRVTAAEFKRTRLQTGDVLIVEGHGNRHEVGRSAVWDGSIDSCVHQNHLICQRRMKMSHFGRMKMSHFSGGEKPLSSCGSPFV